MKKNKILNKSDLCNLLIMTILFVIIIFFTLKNKYIWGSELDWIDQHSTIPEYFRILFYDTHQLFPNLALNLGAGQNIYNFAYYGLLNPVIMISYLFPFIGMRDYLIGSTLMLVYSSVLLFYYFLRSNNYSEKVSFLSTLCFMCASPLLFHSHRHIMFINYMPFLILALIGVDKYFKNKNTLILSLSVLLIILMSFYYSISSIFCIAVYWIYKYISYNEKIQFKSFMKAGLKFLIPVMIGILLSSILIVPEFYAITVGRMKVASDISLWKLITPNINISYIAFYSYGVGLTSLVLISLVTLLFNKNKEHKFLSIILSLFVLFPLFNCVLNGFMYIDAKILIPFLPLYVLSIAIFIDNFYNHKIELNKTIIAVLLITALSFIEGTYRYIYLIYEIILTLAVIALCYKKRYYKLFNVYTVIVLMFLSLTINSTDKLILKDDNIYKNDIYQEKLVDYITESDKNIYRITTLVDKKHTSNTTFSNIDMYQDVMYSSLYNEEYNKFYYDVFNNQVQSRNRILTTPSANILFLMFMGNKYLLSENDSVIGYNLYKTENNIKAYYNNDVLPFMYVSYNTFNKEEFGKTEFPFSNEILLNYAVTEDGTDKSFNSNIHKFDILNLSYSGLDVVKENNSYSFNATDKSKVYIELPSEVKDIVFIKFNMDNNQSCCKGDQAVIINGEINKLTCKEWKYHNGNTTFTYTLSTRDTKSLEIEFYKGSYTIGDVEFYYLDYNNIKDVNDKVTEVNIDKNKTKGDKIFGKVNATDNGYLVTTIPYQKGFKIYIDEKEIEYENINSGFIGFKINKGNHDMLFVYTSPYKNVGIALSCLGLLCFIIMTVVNIRKSNRTK